MVTEAFTSSILASMLQKKSNTVYLDNFQQRSIIVELVFAGRVSPPAKAKAERPPVSEQEQVCQKPERERLHVQHFQEPKKQQCGFVLR